MESSTTCGWVRRFLGPWKDGELDPGDAARIERHLSGCGECAAQARFERWFSGEVGRLADRPRAPDRLADRIALELRREHRRQRVRRTALAVGGLAAAAGLAAVVAFGLQGAPPAGPVAGERVAAERLTGAGGGSPSSPPAPPGFQLAAMHDGGALQARVTTSDAEQAAAWFRGRLDLPAALPRLDAPTTRLVGAGLARVRGENAAHLRYDVAGRPVSLLVMPGGTRPLGGDRVWDVRGRTVFAGRQGPLGYVVFRDDDLVCVLISELPEEALLDLVPHVR